jgi:hypothetical protein
VNVLGTAELTENAQKLRRFFFGGGGGGALCYCNFSSTVLYFITVVTIWFPVSSFGAVCG